MKKMPCLFQRDFSDPRKPILLRDVTPGCEWVLEGKGVATIKRDGTACAVINGKLHKRYDAKRGKTPPASGIPCCDPDPVTGHWPHWVPVGDEAASKYHQEAWHGVSAAEGVATCLAVDDGTYELCGPKFSANPEGLSHHHFFRHGHEVVDVPMRTFAGIMVFLDALPNEGVVFWREPDNADGDMCKIRRCDFGFDWPMRKGEVA